jgi:hypothetical protein
MIRGIVTNSRAKILGGPDVSRLKKPQFKNQCDVYKTIRRAWKTRTVSLKHTSPSASRVAANGFPASPRREFSDSIDFRPDPEHQLKSLNQGNYRQ